MTIATVKFSSLGMNCNLRMDVFSIRDRGRGVKGYRRCLASVVDAVEARLNRNLDSRRLSNATVVFWALLILSV